MATKVSRKELKEPDEFISFTQRFLTWINEQKKALITGAAALCVAIVVVVGWQWYQDNTEKAASMAFVSAQEILSAPVVPEEEPAEGEDPPEVPEGSFPTEKAKLEAALAEFSEVKKRHGSTRPGAMATYFIGECQLRLGQHPEAEQTLKEYLKSEGPSTELALFALEGVGAALEAQGKVEDAKAQYLRLTEPPFDGQPDRGLYHLARLAQKAGQTKEAVEKFNQILEKYPNTPFRQEIQGRLDRLPKIAKAPEKAPEKKNPAATPKTDAPGKKPDTQPVKEAKPEQPSPKGAE